MDQMLKSHRCFHLNKEGFVLLNHSIAFQGNKPRQHLNDMSKNLNCKIKCLWRVDLANYPIGFELIKSFYKKFEWAFSILISKIKCALDSGR
ncbi:hypothetical protein BpHYR1_052659 [Brachionus plicatilis]|uniref:Uncharacterized protein n=1 Tax=Brachionus plicatilis TaxID=10195 RepID=A0A3M7P2R2_BRAPC|nr:hypothetical protein BpHYR1_052659 [Brachionus plicatilis]